MPEAVEECVDSVLDDNPDYSESRAYAICWSQQNEGNLKEAGDDFECAFSGEVQDLSKDNDALTDDEAASVVAVSKLADDADDRAVKAVAYRSFAGQWGGYHPAETTKDGREHLLETYKSTVDSLLKEWNNALDKVDDSEDDENVTVDKSQDDFPTVKFKMQSSTGILPVFKSKDGDMIIWGPASVEVVDKEGDKIRASALEDALPQLLRRQRLSLEHSDQLVGEILENFETDEPITVEVDGKTFEREEFPTDVLELDDMEPSLFVAGKIWDDTRQSRQAQKDIENGDLDSYSISGESLVATTKYEEGDVVNDIKELDLSAVTLCEEGMNQKAKFGVVSKADGDARTDEGDNVENGQAAVSKGARGPAGVHADGTIHIVKNMGDNESESDGASNPSEAVSLDDVREEFKNVVDESLPDAELATKDDMVSKDDVESIVEEKSMGEDEVRSIARKTAEEVLDEKGDYEDEEPEDDEEKGDDEMPPEDEEEDEEPEPVEAEDDEEPEDEPEVDDEVAPEPPEDEPDEEKGEDYEEDDEDEEMKGYDHGDLEEMLPEDLYEAVREYLDEDDGGDEVVEASESDEEGLTEDDVEKMIEEQFGDEMVLDSPSGPTAEVQKSWEQEDEPATDDQVGPAAQQLYDL
ncbi:prohead protease [Haloarcula virus HVTV-2]|uniref:Prohead protease n=1 Tax=Haloarcula vallismortis tailed virus 1 TaxID=1262528 RepID=L7TJC6_9CAUD|nr:head maturation protease [Haloarcula vallismortis tailed virus 1]AGC34488.1 prohead protease [Haloarcula vallismortis tailed virus 1]UBF22927.1 prohead protease [Haloarcula virus HVTV-2]